MNMYNIPKQFLNDYNTKVLDINTYYNNNILRVITDYDNIKNNSKKNPSFR